MFIDSLRTVSEKWHLWIFVATSVFCRCRITYQIFPSDIENSVSPYVSTSLLTLIVISPLILSLVTTNSVWILEEFLPSNRVSLYLKPFYLIIYIFLFCIYRQLLATWKLSTLDLTGNADGNQSTLIIEMYSLQTQKNHLHLTLY